MKSYPNTQSTISPQEFEVNPYRVFVAKNIQFIEVEEQEDPQQISYYQYDLYEYTPEEYIEILKQQNDDLNQEVLDTQMALCDIYEAMNND